jgi:hypothetical protein
MKRIDPKHSDNRYYPDPNPKPAVSPGLSHANTDPKLCAWCKTAPVPRSTMAKPVSPNRKYCDACMPIVAKLRLDHSHAEEKRKNGKKR